MNTDVASGQEWGVASDPDLMPRELPRQSSATVADWFDGHAGDIAAYASRRVGATAARDVVADTFRVALERFEEFDPDRGSERAWLFGIATNMIRRHWRSEARRLRAQAELAGRVTAEVDPLLRVEHAVDARRNYEALVEHVLELEPEDRDLLVLVAWERMSSREAAAVLGVPSGTVRSRLHRIRTLLAGGATDG